nr:MAG TPA: putative transcriptional regulator [Caudoviricetes sp.]
MTDKLFSTLWAAALNCTDRDAYVSDWSLSSAWGDAPEAEIPAARIEILGQLWDAAHLTIRDIRAHTGLSQAAFATRYCIPRRSVENWESGDRQCADYVRLLLAEAAGLYVRP